MKGLRKIVSLGMMAATVAIAISFTQETPVWAEIQTVGQSVLENLQRQPAVKLELSAAKQITETDAQGQTKISWQTLSGEQVLVQPGDTLRYTMTGETVSNQPVKNLVVTQPVPAQTTYVLDSATVANNQGAAITYSIDNGQTFVVEPKVMVTLPDGTVEEQPAPAEVYTHIRWNFGESVAAETVLNGTYDVQVR